MLAIQNVKKSRGKNKQFLYILKGQKVQNKKIFLRTFECQKRKNKKIYFLKIIRMSQISE